MMCDKLELYDLTKLGKVTVCGMMSQGESMDNNLRFGRILI